MSSRKRESDETFQFYREDQCTEDERIKDHLKGRVIWSSFLGPYRRSVHGVIGTIPENRKKRGY